MPPLRAVYVLSVFLLSSIFVIPWQTIALRFQTLGYKRVPFLYQRFLMKLFDVRVTIIGTPVQDRGVLMVANHTSYLDILALGGSITCSFVAKSEVGSWPFFGTFARLQRTVFVERQRRSKTAESRDLIRDRLREGDALVLFPEGTSNDGNRVLPFKSALMGAAEADVGVDSEGRVKRVPVQPVSIAYVGVHGIPMGREFRPLYAWYGDMDLIPHLWEGLLTGPLDVVIHFHPPLTVDSAGGRKALAKTVEDIIRRGQAEGVAGKRPAAAVPDAQPTGEPAAAPAEAMA